MNTLCSRKQAPSVCFCLLLLLFPLAAFGQTPEIAKAQKVLDVAKRDTLNTPQYATALRDLWLAYRAYIWAEKQAVPDTLKINLVQGDSAYRHSMDSLVLVATKVKKKNLPSFWKTIHTKEQGLYEDIISSLDEISTCRMYLGEVKALRPYRYFIDTLLFKMDTLNKLTYFENLYNTSIMEGILLNLDTAQAILEKGIKQLEQEIDRFDKLPRAQKKHPDNQWFRKGKPFYCTLITELGDVYARRGNYDLSLFYHKKGVDLMKLYCKDTFCQIRKDALELPYSSLAETYEHNGKLDSAIQVLEEGISLFDKTATPDLRRSVFFDYLEKGDLSKAEYQMVENLRFAQYKRDTMTSKAEFFIFYIRVGLFDKADTCLKEYSKEIEQNYSMNSSYGVLYCIMRCKLAKIRGIYNEAEYYANKEQIIYEFLYGHANDYRNLADIYNDLGQYDKSLLMRYKSHKVLLATTFEYHVNRILSWSGIGKTYLKMGKLDSAKQCFEKAFDIIKASHKQKTVDLSNILNNLGYISELQHDYNSAEKLFDTALSAGDSLEIANVYDKSLWLMSVARILRKQKKHTEAIEKNEKVVSILRGLESNEFYRQAQLNRALIHESLNQNTASADSLESLFQNIQTRIVKEFAYLPEQDKVAFMTMLDNDFFGTMQAAYARLYAKGETAKSSALFYNTVLMQKELSLVDTRSLKRKASILNDTLLFAQLFKLNALEEQIKSDKPIPTTERQRMSEEITQIKRGLEQKYPQLFEKDWTKINWQSVQKQLKTNEIAIEFADVLNNDDDTTKLRHYYALLITPNSPHPTVIPLFEEQALINILDATLVKEHFERKGLPDTLMVNDAKTVAKRYNTTNGKKLSDLIWQPLENARLLRGVTRVHFAPSGLLNRISFSALPIVRDTFTRLMEVYQLRQYNTTRAIVETATQHNTSAKDLVLFGDIQYGNCEGDSSKIAEVEAVQDRNTLATRSALFLDSVSICWAQLAHSKTEVERISRIQKKQQPNADFKAWTGYSAGEARFKSYGSYDKPSPSTLYITSHGFGNPSRYPESRYASAALHRAGLVMAGANWTTCCHTQRDPDAEDGILTAYEIAQLNLSNTELVVLNGCQTGLGDIWGREGVFGLTRGFKLAGVNYIIASLWEVPDAEAADFMTAFYSTYLSGKSITEAFDQTRQTMQKKQSANSWAAWVLIR